MRAQDLWLIDPDRLEAAQDDATLLAIRDQERAGLDIVTDGEQRRESYSNRFATALDGYRPRQSGQNPQSHRRVFNRAAGGGTDSAQASGRGARRGVPARQHGPHDQDDGAGALHHVGAVRRTISTGTRNAWRSTTRRRSTPRSRICSPPAPTSCRSTSRGCSAAGEGAANTGSRRSTARSTASAARRRCTSASAMPRWCRTSRPAIRSCAEFERSAVEQISIEAAQPKLDLSILQQLPSKTIILGVHRSLRHDGRDAGDRRRAHPQGACRSCRPIGSWSRRIAA